ncbi:hypothetical protein [Streptomyces sp. NPDC059949]|uniref:hypothetical protein n=1 Tax=Streptomyces sp. NPDC059949 TaxID=3347013 RepID=UPI00366A4F5F
MSITPFTRGRRNRSHGDTTPMPPQPTETEDTAGADETQLRRTLSRIGARPVGHAEQNVEEDPAPAVAEPEPDRLPVTSTRRISTVPGGGRLPVPGQTIELTDAPQQEPEDEPAPAEDQDVTGGRPQPPDARAAGEERRGAWPPRTPWRRHNNDQAEAPGAAEAGEETHDPAGDAPDWYRVQKTTDPLTPDPGTYEVHNHYYGSGPDTPAPSAGEGPGPSRINRGSLTAWWASRTPWQRFILHHGSAAAAGAWGWGMLTARWDIGLPQWTLALMHDAAASSNEPSTPFIAGAGVILLAAVVGGGITAFVERWLYRLPSFCAAVRFLTHVPVASAGIAVLLFSAPTL